ncbi:MULTISPECIES: SPOR domain-containing protein [Dyella]|uniref:SPOR domain-containing protein n=2 Tax=Dyella TaxID=231454 RepID=A0A4V2NLF6_9GAMM|nr:MULTISPECIES: SPOR domain-containing protein [Dyella]TBR35788.1 SPOR domain-containing protein [Dyella terrae]TCI08664.1 SPOR domain-containing protein [Dyella soli]
MAPRKGKGRQAVRNNSGGFPAWGWAIVGILVGAVLMFAMRGKLPIGARPSDAPQPNAEATAQRGSDAGAVEPSANESAPAPKKPQFDFYSVLSEKEVRIPDAEISAQARAEQQQKQAAVQQAQQQAAAQQAAQQRPPANTPAAVTENITAAPAATPAPQAAGTGYLLQVGAFPSAADAEALKAKLALQGFVANVASVNVNGQTYNRVRLGPFKSATELESAKQRLSSAGINAIALKEGR